MGLAGLPSQEKLDQIEVFTGDIRDPNGVREAMKGVDGVFHLAALIAIPFSYHSPDSYVDTNIKGTLNVLQRARDLGTERVLVTSTSEVYVPHSMCRLMKNIRFRVNLRTLRPKSERNRLVRELLSEL